MFSNYKEEEERRKRTKKRRREKEKKEERDKGIEGGSILEHGWLRRWEGEQSLEGINLNFPPS